MLLAADGRHTDMCKHVITALLVVTATKTWDVIQAIQQELRVWAHCPAIKFEIMEFVAVTVL
jgi:hypothetical protein